MLKPAFKNYLILWHYASPILKRLLKNDFILHKNFIKENESVFCYFRLCKDNSSRGMDIFEFVQQFILSLKNGRQLLNETKKKGYSLALYALFSQLHEDGLLAAKNMEDILIEDHATLSTAYILGRLCELNLLTPGNIQALYGKLLHAGGISFFLQQISKLNHLYNPKAPRLSYPQKPETYFNKSRPDNDWFTQDMLTSLFNYSVNSENAAKCMEELELTRGIFDYGNAEKIKNHREIYSSFIALQILKCDRDLSEIIRELRIKGDLPITPEIILLLCASENPQDLVFVLSNQDCKKLLGSDIKLSELAKHVKILKELIMKGDPPITREIFLLLRVSENPQDLVFVLRNQDCKKLLGSDIKLSELEKYVKILKQLITKGEVNKFFPLSNENISINPKTDPPEEMIEILETLYDITGFPKFAYFLGKISAGDIYGIDLEEMKAGAFVPYDREAAIFYFNECISYCKKPWNTLAVEDLALLLGTMTTSTPCSNWDELIVYTLYLNEIFNNTDYRQGAASFKQNCGQNLPEQFPIRLMKQSQQRMDYTPVSPYNKGALVLYRGNNALPYPQEIENISRFERTNEESILFRKPPQLSSF